jgi:hypothetical protein
MLGIDPPGLECVFETRGASPSAAAAPTSARGTRQLPPGSHALLGKRDVNLIDIHAEPFPSVNTVPNRCLARFDVRLPPPARRKRGCWDVPCPDSPNLIPSSLRFEPTFVRTPCEHHVVAR